MSTDDPTSEIVNETPAVIRWVIRGPVRHAITGLGVYMLAKGVLPSTTAEQAFIDWAVNGALIIIGLGWSFLDHKSQQEVK